ncbi:laccase-2-like [Ctenocephalides felis]|uniref:laccase-2-like n=1 Tax=Ctenocephalides felis TaxID=7515 RepID=UPI000E6E551A|nr:laccase-2-like [Ctenocephalides felis]
MSGKVFSDIFNKIMLCTFILFGSLCLVSTSNSTEELDQIFEYVPLNGSEHPCIRLCVKDTPKMICRYHFKIEEYRTMSKACFDCPHNIQDCDRPHCVHADGVPRGVVVVNRQLPGPSIQVCRGDTVIIDVENELMTGSTSIHWHGHHQRDTPYMDGVPKVTQCPIAPGTTFRYQFDVQQVGTHFWHSHSGMQRADGAFGSFIVREPVETNPHADLYDYDLPEHVLVILDWEHQLGMDKFLAHHHGGGNNKPPSLLINGKGRFRRFPLNKTEENATDVLYTPTARFTVEPGFRYRFRVINAEFLNCPIEISVDNHTMTVISTDGFDTQPVEVESLVTYAGERFDFIIDADQDTDNYWIRMRGLMDCDSRFTKAHQVAVLHYDGASDDEPDLELSWELNTKEGLQLNALNKGPGHNDTMTVAEMKSVVPTDPSLKETPDYKFFLSYDFHAKNNPLFHQQGLYGFNQVKDKKYRIYTPQINHITLKLPPFNMLSGRSQFTSESFCNATSMANAKCVTNFCSCTHVLSVKLKSVVELILVDQGFTFDANHPFHLHGHAFRVVAMNKIGPHVTTGQVKDLDEMGLIKRNLNDSPPLKDTVTVPDGGFTILRFYADNPGYWLFHCHIEFHVELGMALVFKVGEDDEMPPTPKNFPQCDNWIPEDLKIDSNSTETSGSACSMVI